MPASSASGTPPHGIPPDRAAIPKVDRTVKSDPHSGSGVPVTSRVPLRVPLRWALPLLSLLPALRLEACVRSPVLPPRKSMPMSIPAFPAMLMPPWAMPVGRGHPCKGDKREKLTMRFTAYAEGHRERLGTARAVVLAHTAYASSFGSKLPGSFGCGMLKPTGYHGDAKNEFEVRDITYMSARRMEAQPRHLRPSRGLLLELGHR